MTKLLDQAEAAAVAAPELTLSRSRTVAWVSIFAMAIGIVSVLGGIFGIAYTYNQASLQDITTPDDAAIASTPVRGPLSMWAQSDIITHHQLERTDGLYYAQMDRTVPMLDENGEVVLDEAGEAVMVPNEARTSWITATTLTTSLGLGMLAYAFSAFALVIGLVLFALGYVVYRMRTPVYSLS